MAPGEGAAQPAGGGGDAGPGAVGAGVVGAGGGGEGLSVEDRGAPIFSISDFAPATSFFLVVRLAVALDASPGVLVVFGDSAG